MLIRSLLVAVAALILMTAGADAQGCRRGNQVGSSYGSTGINTIAPSRAIQNPCSSMYHFGTRGYRLRHVRRGPVVR